MKKKSIQLIVVLLVVLLGVIVLVVVKNRPASDDATETTMANISIVEKDVADLESISLKGEKDGVAYDDTFYQDEESTWYYDNDLVNVTSDKIKDIATYVASFSANRVVSENTDNLAQFGLDKPTTATGNFKDGSQITIQIGNKTPTGDAYYVKLQNDSKVYTAENYTAEKLTKSLSDLRSVSFETANTEQSADYFIMSGKDRPHIEIYRNPRNEQTKHLNTATYVMTSPYDHIRGISDDNFNGTFIGLINSISVNKFVEDDPEDLSVYGLDDPVLEIELAIPTLEEGEELTDETPRSSWHFIFGSNADDETIYFKTGDAPNVYTTNISNIQKFLDATPFFLSDKAIALTNILYIDGVTISRGSEVYDMVIESETIPGETKEDGTKADDTVNHTYKVNGVEYEETAFKAAYRSVIALAGDAEIPADVNEKVDFNSSEKIVIDYSGNDEGIDIYTEYYPYDSNFYVAYKDGIAMFAVNARSINFMFSELSSLVE